MPQARSPTVTVETGDFHRPAWHGDASGALSGFHARSEPNRVSGEHRRIDVAGRTTLRPKRDTLTGVFGYGAIWIRLPAGEAYAAAHGSRWYCARGRPKTGLARRSFTEDLSKEHARCPHTPTVVSAAELASSPSSTLPTHATERRGPAWRLLPRRLRGYLNARSP